MAHAERNERRISITFRNGIEKLITLDKEAYAIVAVLGKRVYFKKASSIEGFKISSNKGNKNKAGNKYMYISENNSKELYNFVADHIGNYDLKYDNDRNLHYVNCE